MCTKMDLTTTTTIIIWYLYFRLGGHQDDPQAWKIIPGTIFHHYYSYWSLNVWNV